MPSVVSVIEHDHVIRSTGAIIPGETLFWCNKNGWGDLESATGFTEAEKNTVSLPAGGEWVSIRELTHSVDVFVTDRYIGKVKVLATSPEEASRMVRQGEFDPSEIEASDEADPETEVRLLTDIALGAEGKPEQIDHLARLAAELQALRAKGIGGALTDDIEIDGVSYLVRIDTEEYEDEA